MIHARQLGVDRFPFDASADEVHSGGHSIRGSWTSLLKFPNDKITATLCSVSWRLWTTLLDKLRLIGELETTLCTAAVSPQAGGCTQGNSKLNATCEQ